VSAEPSSELSRPAAHALLHVTVILWGFTAILGRQISIHAIPLVWYRVLVVVAAFAILMPARGMSMRIPARAMARYAVVGALIGLHWLCFYGAIKQAGIPTAVLTLSTITFFTAVFEPIAFRRRVAVGELAIGAVVVVGVALLVQVELHPDPFGLVLGFASALFAAIFGVLNGRLARHEPPMRLMLYEMGAAIVVVSASFAFAPSQLVAPWQLSAADIAWLAILGVFCTVIPQLWALIVLRTLSPFTVAVSVNLEPVYSLILAAVLFPDSAPLSARFYGGTAVLLALVLLNGVRKSLRT